MSGAATPLPKADPETLALRAQPRPVVRLNRRALAAGAGTLAAAVLGGTLWSLQSQQRSRAPGTELYNVDRIAKAESLDRLPKDYAGLVPPPKATPPVLGEPLPGDLGPAIVKSQQPMAQRMAPHGTTSTHGEIRRDRVEARA